MGIEEALKAKKINNEYQKLFINFSYTFNWIDEQVAKFFKNHNLTNHQYNILRILRGSLGTPLPAFEIQNRMICKNSNVTRIIEKLIAKQYVSKKFNDDNRRKVEITITDKGLELLNSLDNAIISLHSNIFKNITEEESVYLNDMLDRIRG
jgi:DNA-binding MarR family transcriptional regulator